MGRSKERHAEWQRARRVRLLNDRIPKAKLILGGVCVVCGTTEKLEFDHVDPATRLFYISKGDRYSEEVFWLEVAKCQLLCRPHHVEKSKHDGSRLLGISLGGNIKIREIDVKYIRGLSALGHSQRAIAKELGIGQSTVSDVITRKTWEKV